MGFDLSIREQVRDKLRGLQGRFHLGSAGIDAFYIALGQSDYLMHSKLTPWDSVPVALICKELGYYVRLAPDETQYYWQSKGVLLADWFGGAMAKNDFFYLVRNHMSKVIHLIFH